MTDPLDVIDWHEFYEITSRQGIKKVTAKEVNTSVKSDVFFLVAAIIVILWIAWRIYNV